jgi:hypothetical protein
VSAKHMNLEFSVRVCEEGNGDKDSKFPVSQYSHGDRTGWWQRIVANWVRGYVVCDVDGRGEWLREDSESRADAWRNNIQVLAWQGDVLSETSVVAEYTNGGPCGAVCAAAVTAGVARRRAGPNIYIGDNKLICNVARRDDTSNKLMAQNTVKFSVAFRHFNVGGTYTCVQYLRDQELWQGSLTLIKTADSSATGISTWHNCGPVFVSRIANIA